MPIKGLIFDAYGTLYDVHSVHAKTEELCPGKGDLITQIWRLKQLEYTWLQTSLQEYRDFTYLTQVSLEFALRAAGVEPSENITTALFEKYLDLDPYPEAKEALAALKKRGGSQLAILSNGSTAMLSALVKNSGIDALLNATISVDGARKFKPHPDCYALVEKTLGLNNDDVLFVRPTDSTSPAPNISASRWPGSGAVAARHCRPVRSGPRKCIGSCAAIPKRWVTCRITRSRP